MTKGAALFRFFNNVIPGVTAYPETAVPSKDAGDDEDAQFPYLTYQAGYSALDEGEVSIPVNLWYHTENETPPNNAVQILSGAIGRDGYKLPCDGGYIWLKRGRPFAQPVDTGDNRIKRRYVNLVAEFLTLD